MIGEMPIPFPSIQNWYGMSKSKSLSTISKPTIVKTKKTKTAKKKIELSKFPETYTKLLAAATPLPWQANTGRHGLLGQAEKDMTRFWSVQTNVVRNGPEATIAHLGLSVRGEAENPHLWDIQSHDPKLKAGYSITDEEHAANAALLAHSATVLPQAYGALLAVKNMTDEEWATRGIDFVYEAIAAIETVNIWVR